MHDTSWDKMVRFVEVHLDEHTTAPLEILDVGSQIVVATHPTYRSLFERPGWTYTGLDVQPGINVDIAVADPYRWDDVAADAYDVVVSGQALEHVAYFWQTAFEIGRVLKPGGVTMLIAPSGGPEHRYPLDCWRYYTDGMRAIADSLGFEVVDVGTDWAGVPWSDSYLVMRKPVWSAAERAEFLRRRDLQYAALFGGDVATPADVPAEPASISVLASARPGQLTEALAKSAEPAALEPVSGWRARVRGCMPDRVLAVYRAARYGRSHL